MPIIANLVSLIMAVFGNLALSGEYLKAMLWPIQNYQFVYLTGTMFWLVEFLSIHSTGMAYGFKASDDIICEPSFFKRNSMPIVIILAYSAFALVIGLAFKSWLIAGMLMISIMAKFFGSHAAPDQRRWMLQFVVFLLSTFVTLFFGMSSIVRFFPLPAELVNYRPSGVSGLWVDTPQAILIWGILYYFILAVIEVYLYFNPPRRRGVKLRDTNLEI